MKKELSLKISPYVMFAILILANIFGGFFSFLSGFIVAIMFLAFLIGIVIFSALNYQMHTGIIDSKNLIRFKEHMKNGIYPKSFKVSGAVFGLATYALIYGLHWYVALAWLIVLHATFLILYFSFKKMIEERFN